MLPKSCKEQCKKLTTLNIVSRTIKSYVKNCKYQFCYYSKWFFIWSVMAFPLTQIVERILSSVHGTALLLFPFPQLISVSILRSVNSFIELTRVTPMRLLRASAMHSIVYGRQYSLNCLRQRKRHYRSHAKPFRVLTILILQFLTYDLIVLNTVFKLVSFLH
jgi:hypothetical protein